MFFNFRTPPSFTDSQWDQAHHRAVAKEAQIQQREAHLRRRQTTPAGCIRMLAETQITLEQLQNTLDAIESSRSWRLVKAYARLKQHLFLQPVQTLKAFFLNFRPESKRPAWKAHIWQTYQNMGVRTLPQPATFALWLSANQTAVKTLLAQYRAVQDWRSRPQLTVIVPIYNPNIKWLEKQLSSIVDQTYDRWEAILVDDHSSDPTVLRVVQGYCQSEARFTLLTRPSNGGIAAAIQDGLEAANGKFVAVADHDDWLSPDALYQLAVAIQAHPETDLFYTDEALVDDRERVIGITFRPSFSYARLLSHPYIVHLYAFRRKMALAVGGFDPAFQVSEDYDFLLRLAACTQQFHHIPKVLYYWRQHADSAGHQKRRQVTANSVRALKRHLLLKKVTNASVEPGLSFNFFRVRYVIPPTCVSIIIPVRDRIELLENCLDSLQNLTQTPPGVQLQIVIADNDSRLPETHAYLQRLTQSGHQVISCPGRFNFSAINNRAAEHARGDMLLFLNNDIEIIEPGWLTALLEQMQPSDVGAVGAKSIYPMGLVQNAGVIIGMAGLADHSHQFFYEQHADGYCGGHQNELLCIRECCALSAACLLVRKAAFDNVNGFCEDFAVGLGDTDLCLRMRQAGYRIVWTPYARVIHYESITRGKSGDALHLHPQDSALFKKRWHRLIEAGDPYHNPNLSLNSGCFEPVFQHEG